ncbi:hypothetical protein EVAR_99321_1 [Eumeta japonica]|uniref:Uncharacterized protein n=1 Tax=Eumeta variegata TaxID=151549 RepID=A0A4C1TBY0_EUMVA|nr:hypothetical protein EVAR_99321_1 [Eumeta japonica]
MRCSAGALQWRGPQGCAPFVTLAADVRYVTFARVHRRVVLKEVDKIFTTVRNSADCLSIQNVLNVIEIWCTITRISLTVEEYFVIAFSNR